MDSKKMMQWERLHGQKSPSLSFVLKLCVKYMCNFTHIICYVYFIRYMQ